jgi:hypothetical protein
VCEKGIYSKLKIEKSVFPYGLQLQGNNSIFLKMNTSNERA